MYILKNAFQNLFQNAGRNLLTAAIFLLVITMSCVALVVYNLSLIHIFLNSPGVTVGCTPAVSANSKP